MRGLRVIIAITALLVGSGLAFAPSASAALGGTIDSIEHVGCYLYVTFTVEDAGTYAINTWDDGTYNGGSEIVAEAGSTHVLPLHIQWPFLQGAAGIGIYLEDDASDAATVTYDSNGSYNDPGAVAAAAICAQNAGTDSGDPAGAAINSIDVDACDVVVHMTATGLGEYTILAADGSDVLVETDVDLNSGERADVELVIEDFEGSVDIVVTSLDGEQEFASDSVEVSCRQATTTTTTESTTTTTASTTTTTAPVEPPPAQPVPQDPNFTG